MFMNMRLPECDYCQGGIDGPVAYWGGLPFHPECLQHKHRVTAENLAALSMINEIQSQIKRDRKMIP
jgi:hypothetical protein